MTTKSNKKNPLNLIIRDPGYGYIDNWLWLPKKLVPDLKGALTVPLIAQGKIQGHINLWSDSKNHIGVPREMPIENPRFPIVDLRPHSYERISFTSDIVLDSLQPNKTDQKDAFANLVKAKHGILNLSCGIGKTILFLHAISKWRVPVLIINDRGHILKQWKDEINKHLSFTGGIGTIQGPPKKWKWEHPITMASMMSLAIHKDEMPLDLSKFFGAIIWDEVHHLGARTFSLTAPLFIGHRYGASATTKRTDNLDIVYRLHLGKNVHTNLTQDLKPKVLFIPSPTIVNMNHRDCRDRTGQIHIRKLTAHVAAQPSELSFVKTLIEAAIRKKRDLLVLSGSLDQVHELHKMFPNSGIVVGEIDAEDRLRQLAENTLTFGITELAKEAINKRSLDSLLLLTETTSPIMLTQSTGRIQRFLEGKKQTIVMVVWHVNMSPLRNMGRKMMRHFQEAQFKIEVLT